MKQHDSKRRALRQLLDRYCIDRPDRELLIEDILKIDDRFSHNPSLESCKP